MLNKFKMEIMFNTKMKTNYVSEVDVDVETVFHI